MKDITIDLNEKFRLLNDVCFDGRLKPIIVKYWNWPGADGVFLQHADLTGIYQYSIEINLALGASEDRLISVLMHEMTHYWIVSSKIKAKNEHGKRFKKKLSEVESRWGSYLLNNFAESK
jgi:hypothetical protein